MKEQLRMFWYRGEDIPQRHERFLKDLIRQFRNVKVTDTTEDFVVYSVDNLKPEKEAKKT